MCRFNIIYVKTNKSKKLLQRNGYKVFDEDLNGYCPYVYGCCNCDSFVGIMCDSNYTNYSQMSKESYEKNLKRLNKIRDFMHEPNYMKKRHEFEIKRNELQDAIDNIFSLLQSYEGNQSNTLREKYKDEELNKQLDMLYANLAKKLDNMQNTKEFKEANKKLIDFENSNLTMAESCDYFLNKDDEIKYYEENITFQDINEIDPLNTSNMVDTLDSSFVIDDVIARLENPYNAGIAKFEKYVKLFNKLLENEEYILFTTVWSEIGKLSIKKDLNLNNITIEDLALLNYNEILKISKCNTM